MHRRARGDKAEALARDSLIAKGYKLLEHNQHMRFGEIDLIMLSPEGEHVFVEVRSIANNEGITVYELLPGLKLHKLRKAISAWCAENNVQESQCRLDFVGLVLDSESGECIQMEHFTHI